MKKVIAILICTFLWNSEKTLAQCSKCDVQIDKPETEARYKAKIRQRKEKIPVKQGKVQVWESPRPIEELPILNEKAAEYNIYRQNILYQPITKVLDTTVRTFWD